MASKAANGTATLAPQRPPFRRQTSSVSGVHPMTVALPSPVHKVDYSVTKGGARTWAVLLVFMFLCSSLYTVFSAKEIAELAVDLDGDGSVDLDDDVADNIDEVVEQQRRAAKVTANAPPQRGNDKGQKESHNHGSYENIPAASEDDEEDNNPELETQLFAGLRRKIERNMKKVQDMMQGATENHEDDEDEQKEEEKKEVAPKRQKKRERKRKVKEEKVEEQDEDEEEAKEKEPVKQKKEPRRRKQRKQVESEEEEEEEEKEKEDDDDDKENETPKEEEKDEEDDDDDDEEDKKEENSEEKKKEEEETDEEDEDEVPQRQGKHRRRHASRAITAGAPERECRRKHCPPANTAEPRKGLLKRKKGESSSLKRYRPLSRAQIEEYEDDIPEDEEEDQPQEEDQVEPAAEPVMEVIALKKYRSSGREAYKRHAITNRDDHRHREELDQADFLVEKHSYKEAIAHFDAVLRGNPDSPRAHFGKGRAYDIRSEYSASEKDADLAIKEYEQVLENDETPDALFRQAASRLIEKARFRGQMHRCLRAQRSLIDRFPEEISLQTDIGLTFLMMKRYDDARKVFKDIIEIDPNNAMAQAYYGFILKVCDHDVEGGVNYMRKGLRLGGDNIIDAKFYYHLGHGLMMMGKETEAYGVYEKGAELGLFLSAEQRSMYNMEGLTGRPWWTLEQTSYTKHLKALERNWVAIRAEAVRVWNDEEEEWVDMNEDITVDGEWKAFRLMHNGFFDEENCDLTPQTCAMLKDFKAQSNATKSEMFLSVLTSGTQVLPHCGPSNTRLQAQMGLVVPSEARIRVGHDQRGWKTGKFIVFDDSFEHAVQFDGASSSSFRLVLVIDLWHPEVDPRLRIESDN